MTLTYAQRDDLDLRGESLFNAVNLSTLWTTNSDADYSPVGPAEVLLVYTYNSSMYRLWVRNRVAFNPASDRNISPDDTGGSAYWTEIEIAGGGAGNTVIVSTTAPTTRSDGEALEEGDFWKDARSGDTYFWNINDSSQGYWVQEDGVGEFQSGSSISGITEDQGDARYLRVDSGNAAQNAIPAAQQAQARTNIGAGIPVTFEEMTSPTQVPLSTITFSDDGTEMTLTSPDGNIRTFTGGGGGDHVPFYSSTALYEIGDRVVFEVAAGSITSSPMLPPASVYVTGTFIGSTATVPAGGRIAQPLIRTEQPEGIQRVSRDWMVPTGVFAVFNSFFQYATNAVVDNNGVLFRANRDVLRSNDTTPLSPPSDGDDWSNIGVIDSAVTANGGNPQLNVSRQAWDRLNRTVIGYPLMPDGSVDISGTPGILGTGATAANLRTLLEVQQQGLDYPTSGGFALEGLPSVVHTTTNEYSWPTGTATLFGETANLAYTAGGGSGAISVNGGITNNTGSAIALGNATLSLDITFTSIPTGGLSTVSLAVILPSDQAINAVFSPNLGPINQVNQRVTLTTHASAAATNTSWANGQELGFVISSPNSDQRPFTYIINSVAISFGPEQFSRINSGLSVDEANTRYVSAVDTQAFTTTERDRARDNIGAISGDEIGQGVIAHLPHSADPGYTSEAILTGNLNGNSTEDFYNVLGLFLEFGGTGLDVPQGTEYFLFDDGDSMTGNLVMTLRRNSEAAIQVFDPLTGTSDGEVLSFDVISGFDFLQTYLGPPEIGTSHRSVNDISAVAAFQSWYTRASTPRTSLLERTIGGMVRWGQPGNTIRPAGVADDDTVPTELAVRTELESLRAATTSSLAFKADLNSPDFTGIPTAPTAAAGTRTTQLATTAFATEALENNVDEYLVDTSVQLDISDITADTQFVFVINKQTPGSVGPVTNTWFTIDGLTAGSDAVITELRSGTTTPHMVNQGLNYFGVTWGANANTIRDNSPVTSVEFNVGGTTAGRVRATFGINSVMSTDITALQREINEEHNTNVVQNSTLATQRTAIDLNSHRIDALEQGGTGARYHTHQFFTVEAPQRTATELLDYRSRATGTTNRQWAEELYTGTAMTSGFTADSTVIPSNISTLLNNHLRSVYRDHSGLASYSLANAATTFIDWDSSFISPAAILTINSTIRFPVVVVNNFRQGTFSHHLMYPFPVDANLSVTNVGVRYFTGTTDWTYTLGGASATNPLVDNRLTVPLTPTQVTDIMTRESAGENLVVHWQRAGTTEIISSPVDSVGLTNGTGTSNVSTAFQYLDFGLLNADGTPLNPSPAAPLLSVVGSEISIANQSGASTPTFTSVSIDDSFRLQEVAATGATIPGQQIGNTIMSTAVVLAADDTLFIEFPPSGITIGSDYIMCVTASSTSVMPVGIYQATAFANGRWSNIRPVTNGVVGTALDFTSMMTGVSMTYSAHQIATDDVDSFAVQNISSSVNALQIPISGDNANRIDFIGLPTVANRPVATQEWVQTNPLSSLFLRSENGSTFEIVVSNTGTLSAVRVTT